MFKEKNPKNCIVRSRSKVREQYDTEEEEEEALFGSYIKKKRFPK